MTYFPKIPCGRNTNRGDSVYLWDMEYVQYPMHPTEHFTVTSRNIVLLFNYYSFSCFTFFYNINEKKQHIRAWITHNFNAANTDLAQT